MVRRFRHWRRCAGRHRGRERHSCCRKLLPDGPCLATFTYMAHQDSLAALPPLFSYTDARDHGLSDRELHALRDQGRIEKIARGLFRSVDLHADPDLIEIAFRSKQATLGLASALARQRAHR